MIIFGASGHAKVVCDVAESAGLDVTGFVDDNPPCEELLGLPVRRNDLPASSDEVEAVVAIGSNRVRRLIDQRHRVRWATPVHPGAVVSRHASLGEGTVVMAGVVVNPAAAVGRHCILNTACVVEHDNVLGDYVHISPNAALAGNVTVGEGAHVGIGAQVIQGVTIGAWATVGAGAVVIRDVPDGATVVGNPARVVKQA